MKRRARISGQAFAGIGAILSIVALASACGDSRPRQNAVLRVDSGNPAGIASESISAGQSPDLDSLIGEIARVYQLYAPAAGFNRQELLRILNHYKIPMSDVVLHLIYGMDLNGDSRLSLDELLEGIRTQIAPFRWIGHGSTLSFEQVRLAIDETYPHTLSPARDLLMERLARFDRVTLGGDGDGRLSRAETALAGLAMKLFDQTSFVAPEGATPEEALNARVLRQMLEMQMLGRYPRAASLSELDADSAALERQSFGLELVWAARRVRAPIPRPEAAAILARELVVEVPRAEKLLRLHDLRFAGGDADGKTSATEFFAAAAAVRQAVATIGVIGREPDLKSPRVAFCLRSAQGSGHAPSFKRCDMLYRHLFAALPENGSALFFDGASVPGGSVFWDKLAIFDSAVWEGNLDGRIDATEFAVSFSVLRMLDQAFLILDTDKNGKLSKQEVSMMFAVLGVSDPQAAALFMSIDVGSLGGVEGLMGLVNGDNPSDLKPLDFASRILVLLDGI